MKEDKKNQTEEGIRNLKKSPLKANEYMIHVFEPWGSSKFLRRKLIAKRFQYDDGVVVLKNDKENFEEIFPSVENNEDYLTEEKDVKKKLEAAKKGLQNILSGKDKKTNIKNLKYEIFILEANLHTNVMLEQHTKEIEKIKKDVEKLKDATRDIKFSNGNGKH